MTEVGEAKLDEDAGNRSNQPYALSAPVMFTDDLDDSCLYLHGGQRFYHNESVYQQMVLDSVWRYDLITGHWTSIRVAESEIVPPNLWCLFHWRLGAVGTSSLDPLIFFHLDQSIWGRTPRENISFYQLSAARKPECACLRFSVQQLSYTLANERAMSADAEFDLSRTVYGSIYDSMWHCVDENRFIVLQTKYGLDNQRTPLSTMHTTDRGGRDKRASEWCLFDIFELSRVGELSSPHAARDDMEEGNGAAKRIKKEKMTSCCSTSSASWRWDQISKDSYSPDSADGSERATDQHGQQLLLREWMANASREYTRSFVYNGRLYVVQPSENHFEASYATAFDLSMRRFSLLTVLPDLECTFPGHINLDKPFAAFENALYLLLQRFDEEDSRLGTTELWRVRVEPFQSVVGATATTTRQEDGALKEVLRWKRLLSDMPLIDHIDQSTMACTPDGALYLYDYDEGDLVIPRGCNCGAYSQAPEEESSDNQAAETSPDSAGGGSDAAKSAAEQPTHHNQSAERTHRHRHQAVNCSCCGGNEFHEPPFFGKVRRLWLIKPPSLKNLATRALATSHNLTTHTTSSTQLPSSAVGICLQCRYQSFRPALLLGGMASK